ncbi:hypothetical protein THAOC_34034 [Thalassiosira oceanica]|uniref:Uncharacterized protein n=1 Tax=Thalassiosira oceanica TaxID=159749 RepID=K0R5W2_THAOC|nr:hypothetical protein THAOC_34034 [Thalassiosira oceanica]|eukprot:EJK47264.1 hypothetical protein THAOC_34034 [Thalassiosira oceanica]
MPDYIHNAITARAKRAHTLQTTERSDDSPNNGCLLASNKCLRFGKPLFGRQLEKSSSSVKSLPKQREKLLSRMSPCSQSFVEFFHLVLGVGLLLVDFWIIMWYPDAKDDEEMNRFTFVKDGVTIDGENFISGTILSYYVNREARLNVDIVKQIVQKTRRLVKSWHWGPDGSMSPLHIMLRKKHATANIDVIKYLVGLDPAFLGTSVASNSFMSFIGDGEKRRSPLYEACQNRDITVDIIDHLIREGPAAMFGGRTLPDNKKYNIGMPWATRVPESVDLPIPLLRCKGIETEADAWVYFLKCLEEDPQVATERFDHGQTPLHLICKSNAKSHKCVGVVKFLVETWPDSLKLYDGMGLHGRPIAYLCKNVAMEKSIALAILEYMLEVDSTLASEYIDKEQNLLPLHVAAKARDDLPFLQRLVDCYPLAVETRASSKHERNLPLHFAARYNSSLHAIKFLFDCCPSVLKKCNRKRESVLDLACQSSYMCGEMMRWLVDVVSSKSLLRESETGVLPLTHVLENVELALDDSSALEVVQILALSRPNGMFPIPAIISGDANYKGDLVKLVLSYDPNGASRLSRHPTAGRVKVLPLQLACSQSGLTDFELIKTLYDAHPKAILTKRGENSLDEIAKDCNCSKEIYRYLRAQASHSYVASTRDDFSRRLLTVPNERGSLYLHRVISGSSLGSVKLVCEANLDALAVEDIDGMTPLTIAAKHTSTDVMMYVWRKTFEHGKFGDLDKNFRVYLSILLERADQEEGVNSLDYVNSLFQLLLAHPVALETLG